MLIAPLFLITKQSKNRCNVNVPYWRSLSWVEGLFSIVWLSHWCNHIDSWAEAHLKSQRLSVYEVLLLGEEFFLERISEWFWRVSKWNFICIERPFVYMHCYSSRPYLCPPSRWLKYAESTESYIQFFFPMHTHLW